ncbi:MAG: DUF3667 domain-containing protein [Gammaproteobacteria bacterium]|nr:DUF3667 domain-containing protein [Gammaproteobacteria bacterium]
MEKRTCDNCNLEVVGRFCPICGQNDRNYERSLWRVIGDILREQFDFHSRATRTIRTLVLRPGQLAVEFKSNRRASYVTPIRMYLFSSLLFFFLIAISTSPRDDRVFSFSIDTYQHNSDSDTSESSESDFGANEDSPSSAAVAQEDPIRVEDALNLAESTREYMDDDTYQLVREILTRPEDSPSRDLLVGLLAMLDNAETPEHLWLIPLLVKILHDSSQLVEEFKNNLALIMVVLLPWMVLVSALLNIGRHVRMVHQLVFWMHAFTFAFLLLSTDLILARFLLRGTELAGWVMFIALVVLLVHTYLAFHKFYGGGHLSGILKYLLILFMYSIALLVGFLSVLALSIYNL